MPPDSISCVPSDVRFWPLFSDLCQSFGFVKCCTKHSYDTYCYTTATFGISRFLCSRFATNGCLVQSFFCPMTVLSRHF